ncbi:MAG: hypothetical protein JRF45_03880 [Deltaproteobacteria bacterium]|jgi:hypothetical protein|nr:hypothetical protein [Deltaproteobacteria bacterium]MBW1748283.1 hypothetical protein [Deltaproteobacteria bacterium]MBW1826830.1 hypothetical protein [Deltaproteobacteria bacterium]MBW1969215.1 hypothetical protein [Deltaproteobacteria bacterium]MBW2156500.1 hypothetical protein [Deltaproteobacteria bacterium]
MSKQKNTMALLRENRMLFIIILVVLFLIELEIFAVAAMKSGRKSWLQVFDAKGNVIHETDGQNLSEFNKYYFEKTFGPFEQYQVKMVTRDRPFPFRAWFVAAVGIPVGAMLLFAFFVRTYQSLFYKEEKMPHDPDLKEKEYEYRFEKIIAAISRFNIFAIGFLIFLAVFLYWVIPDLIVYLGRVGTETMTRYKWIFLSAAVIFLGLIVWMIYLRYLLAKKTIDSHMEIKKYRMQLEYDKTDHIPPQLEYDPEENSDAKV